MTEELSPTRLRADLYRVLDHVLASGEPVEVERKGRRIRITADQPPRLSLLRPHSDYLKVLKDDVVHVDWSSEWRP